MDRPDDASDPPEHEIFRAAQYLVQLLAGMEMRPEEYTEKVELAKLELEKMYWRGYRRASAKDVFRRPTVRPPPDEELDLDLEDE